MDSDWHMVSAEGKPVVAHPTLPLVEAFGLDHRCDAHLTCYTIETSHGLIREAIPRLTKPLVAGLDRMRQEEYEREAEGSITKEQRIFAHIQRIVGTMLALDFDLPEHVRWTDAHREQVERLLAEASLRWPILNTPTVFYTTSGGFRLVWVLSEAVDVHGPGGLEDLLFGLVAQAHIAGLTVDRACKDWTRLFRLPRVVRADKPAVEAQTWQQPYYAQSWGRVDFNAKEATPSTGVVQTHPLASFRALSQLALTDFDTNASARDLRDKWKGRIGKSPRDLRDTFRDIAMGEMPDPGTIQTLLTGGGTQSAALKHALSRLKALAYPREASRALPEALYAYKVLVENEDIRVQEGTEKVLHQGISKLSRGLCFCFRDRLGEREIDMSAQFIHSLVVQPARRANAARAIDGTGKVRSESEIDAEVWRLVRWFYQHYRGSLILSQEEAEDDAKDRADLQLRLIAQVGAHQEAITRTFLEWCGREDAVIRDWIAQNWMTMLLLKHEDGRSLLSFSPTGQIHYSAPVEQYGDVLSLGRDCGHNLIPWTTMTKDGEQRLTRADEIYKDYSKVSEGLVLSRLVPSSRIRLERTKDNIIINYIRAIPGMRADIEPKYDPEVDEFLHLLGGDDADKLLDWIATFTLIERPTCALYIQGAPSIGKGMFGLALKNMTVSRKAAPFDQVIGDFQDSMIATPFVWADEKVTTKRMSKAFMDSFKKLISGENDTVNRKGKPHVTIEGNWRVLVTANHANALPWDEEVSGADLDAVRMRLMHVKAFSTPAYKFLEARGQRDGTKGWPEYIMPMHFAHLAATRKVAMGGRFLVEGTSKQYHEDMQTRTSGSDEAIRLLGRMLRDPIKYQSCVFIRNGHVYFNVANGYEVMSQIVANERRKNFPDSERKLTKSIKNVSLGEETESHRVPHGRSKDGKVLKLWKLDMRHIIDWLDRADADADLRQALGDEIWKRDAPQRVQEAYNPALALSTPPPPPPTLAKPPPPPPPTSQPTHNRVVPFPNIGRQSFK